MQLAESGRASRPTDHLEGESLCFWGQEAQITHDLFAASLVSANRTSGSSAMKLGSAEVPFKGKALCSLFLVNRECCSRLPFSVVTPTIRNLKHSHRS